MLGDAAYETARPMAVQRPLSCRHSGFFLMEFFTRSSTSAPRYPIANAIPQAKPTSNSAANGSSSKTNPTLCPEFKGFYF